MCNKLCNCLFSAVLAKRPALDALLLWTLAALWPVSDRPESGRLGCSGRVGGVQSLDDQDLLEAENRGIPRAIGLQFVGFCSSFCLKPFEDGHCEEIRKEKKKSAACRLIVNRYKFFTLFAAAEVFFVLFQPRDNPTFHHQVELLQALLFLPQQKLLIRDAPRKYRLHLG